ncbi:hypothetical protein B296_00048179 [Ensete ventricosum]|uniref:Uncharacterized protein n=1 Tax=Ensete ventricosum TaxID=4639 RepID=A0A426XAD8_ENSVE|nr:hypothetical protein B296_00048179 [Ensete ventricosum]
MEQRPNHAWPLEVDFSAAIVILYSKQKALPDLPIAHWSPKLSRNCATFCRKIAELINVYPPLLERIKGARQAVMGKQRTGKVCMY